MWFCPASWPARVPGPHLPWGVTGVWGAMVVWPWATGLRLPCAVGPAGGLGSLRWWVAHAWHMPDLKCPASDLETGGGAGALPTGILLWGHEKVCFGPPGQGHWEEETSGTDPLHPNQASCFCLCSCKGWS